MKAKAIKTIAEYSMLQKGDRVIVGLSGGADSSALIHLLCSLREELGITVCAVHVNHMLRGSESDRDEAFCVSLCERLGAELRIFRIDIAGRAAEDGIGLEECGRNARYECFEAVAGEDGRIATAHTLSDCAETLLLNITRGCALSGIRSIPPVRGSIIRPLIAVSRAETVDYCRQHGIDYVTDSSNLCTDYSRNKLRLNVIPRLEEINPAFAQAAARLSKSARLDEDFLSQQAERLDSELCAAPELSRLRDTHEALLTRLLSLRYERLSGRKCERLHIERMLELIAAGHGSAELPGRVEARVERSRLFIQKIPDKKDDGNGEWSIQLKFPVSELPDGRTLCLEVCDRSDFEDNLKINKFLFKNAFDYDTITNNPCVRNRRAGDRLRIIGRNITKELRRLQAEAGIPARARAETVILGDDGGVIWAEGFGVDESRAIRGATKRVCVVTVSPKNAE